LPSLPPPTLTRIPLSEPWLTEAEQVAVSQTIASGWLSTAAPMVDDFESAFVARFGFTAGVSTNSGTSALWMALVASGIGRGDEVIVPALSFIATVNPVCYVGATPVFADVAFETFGLCPATVEPLITPRTKAIIATHLYGFACDVVGLRGLAEAYNLTLIEDAAEAFGTTVNGQSVGSFGHFGTFSFNGNKTLTTGSGGMLVGSQSAEIGLVQRLATQAKVFTDGELDHFGVGYNTRMSAIPATMGLVQLARFSELLAKRMAIAAAYEASAIGTYFRGCPPPIAGAVQVPSYWLSTVRLPCPQKRLGVLAQLAAEGIEARPIFKPLPLTQAYAHWVEGGAGLFPVSTQLWQSHINLPSSGTLTQSQQARVIDAVLRHW
jgi:perosamine synthetase